METNNNQAQEVEEYIGFISDTRDGKYTNHNVSFQEIIQCTISREDVSFLENDNIQNEETFLYGIH